MEILRSWRPPAVDTVPCGRYNKPMIDAFQLMAALTRRPDTVDKLLAEIDTGERDRVTATLFKLAAGAREQKLDNVAGGSRVARAGRDS